MGRKSIEEKKKEAKAKSSIAHPLKKTGGVESSKRGTMYQHLANRSIILCSTSSNLNYEISGSIVYVGSSGDNLGAVVTRDGKEYDVFFGTIKLKQ